jgi:hypothetical protein
LQRRWSDRELALASQLVHDVRITQALDSADTHGLAEVMAAGPQLLADWQDAWSTAPRVSAPGKTYGDARGAALVSAAVDVRRAGYHRPARGLQRSLAEDHEGIPNTERWGHRIRPTPPNR